MVVVSECPVWFDTRDGGIFSSLQEMPHDQIDPRYRRLGDILIANEFQFSKGDFDLQPGVEFDHLRCEDLGKIAVQEMIAVASKPVLIDSNILERLFILGIGPARYEYFRKTSFKNMEDFRRAIGSLPGYPERRKFDSWTIADYIRAGAALEQRLGRKPTLSDYKAYAEEGEIPRLSRLTQRAGGPSAINEFLGYPDMLTMDENNYMDYGVRVVELNGVEKFSPLLISILSKRKRGPSITGIRTHFGTWDKYSTLVLERYEAQQKELAARMIRYRTVLAPIFESIDEVPEKVLRRRGAMFDLISCIAAGWPLDKRLALVAKAGNERWVMIHDLTEAFPRISEVDIEIKAETMQLMDEIWQLRYRKSGLLVTQAEMERTRREKSERRKNTPSRLNRFVTRKR